MQDIITIKPSGQAPTIPYRMDKIEICGVEFTKEELAPEVWHAANRALALEQLAKDMAELKADPAPRCICGQQGPDGDLACYCEAHDAPPTEEEMSRMYQAAKDGEVISE